MYNQKGRPAVNFHSYAAIWHLLPTAGSC